MAVFTSVSQDELAAWLERYAVGTLVEMRGIASGIENTNYFVTTTGGRWVLTLFEKLTPAELPFYLDLMGHLARHGIPCPAPVARRDGGTLDALKGKPAALVSRLPGAAVMQPEAAHCAEVGATLARMHVAGRDFGGTLENPRGAEWREATAPAVMPFLDAERRSMLEAELAFQRTQSREALPRGAVHGDLFRDNVLFDGPRIGGVIDFYFAGVDALLFDVAVTLNDWCIDHPSGAVLPEHARAFLTAYQAVRPITAAERGAWPAMLRAAALRFWLSRLFDFYCPRPGELIHAHDPEHFFRILRLRVAERDRAPAL
jgi:homoserine kinase type II